MPAHSALPWLRFTFFFISLFPVLAHEPGGSFRCQVVGDIYGQPVGRVRITLSGGKLTDPRVETCDDRGGCLVSGLDAGKYSVTFQKSGYFPRSNGDPGGYQPVESTIAEQGETDAGVVVLTKVRTISARIKWDNGDSAEHVIAHLCWSEEIVPNFDPAMRFWLLPTRGESSESVISSPVGI